MSKLSHNSASQCMSSLHRDLLAKDGSHSHLKAIPGPGQPHSGPALQERPHGRISAQLGFDLIWASVEVQNTHRQIAYPVGSVTPNFQLQMGLSRNRSDLDRAPTGPRSETPS
ncbi:MAG: hypothetical protein NTW74_00120 [Acidobacteria bacterium]|nr:hypothetical protein [Acidobacteriota bacterium]